MIVRDIMLGKKEDSKKSYENFHENRKLYDLAYPEIVKIAERDIPRSVPARELLCDLANQYFQWILISCYKAELSHVQGFTDLVDAHRSHSISYWEKERGLWALFGEHIAGLDKEERRLLNDKIVADALLWFNRFVKNVNVQYDCTREGLSSVLK